MDVQLGLFDKQSLRVMVLKYPIVYINFRVIYDQQALKIPPCHLNSLCLKNNVYKATSLDVQLVRNCTGL